MSKASQYVRHMAVAGSAVLGFGLCGQGALAADEPAPKFLIGPIITSLLSSVASNVLQGTLGSQSQAANGYGYQQQGRPPAAAPCYFTQNGGDLGEVVMNQLMQAGCQYLAQAFPAPAQPVSAYVTPATQSFDSPPALSYYASGTPNYQGVKVSVLMVNPSGQVVGERPIGNAFYSGERFRLKIQPTFSGLLEVEHIGPSGGRTQLFPKQGMNGFLVSAGGEVVLPLGNSVYEFDAERGNERLVFKVRDPRITSPGQYGGAMMVQDMGSSTFLGQQVADQGQLPYISQAVDIRHQ